MPRLMLKRPPRTAAVSATDGLASADAGLVSVVAGLSAAGAFGGVAAGGGLLAPLSAPGLSEPGLSASGASNVGGAFVSTVGSLSDDLAGTGAAAAGGSTVSVRVSNLRSGNGGISR